MSLFDSDSEHAGFEDYDSPPLFSTSHTRKEPKLALAVRARQHSMKEFAVSASAGTITRCRLLIRVLSYRVDIIASTARLPAEFGLTCKLKVLGLRLLPLNAFVYSLHLSPVVGV